jgi:hypothetical protein
MKRESSRDLKSVPHCYGQFGNSIYKRYVYISRCAQFICCGNHKTSFVNIDPATLDEMMSEVPQSRVQSRRKTTRMYAT